MKLAFSTLPCATWSLEKTLRICNENGIGAIEMRLGLNEWSGLEMTPEQVAGVQTLLKQHGVIVCNFGTSIVVKDYDAGQMQQILQCISLARQLGAKGLRIMLGTYKIRYSEAAAAADQGGIQRWLREACAAAAKADVEIWIETHNEFATGAALRKVLDAVKAPNLKVIWDIIHPLELKESIEDTLALIGHEIAHLHLKDGKPWEDPDLANWHYTKLGEGILPIAKIVRLMQQRNYPGFYSLEWESMWRPEIRGEGFEGEVVIPDFASYMRKI